MKKKNAFLTFCCACVPGCGQMYQGYMKRGASIMFWFAALIALAVLLNLMPLLFFMFVVWAYSFFDSFNIRNLSPEQRAAFYDDYIPSARWLQQSGFERLLSGGRTRKIVAWVLIGIGAVTLYNNIINNFLWNFIRNSSILWRLYSSLPSILIGAVVVWLGLRMLRGGRPNRQDDDLHHYIGDGNHEK